MSDKQKHPGGRPTKYRPEFVEQAEQLCRDEGFTDKQLAAKFTVSVKQLYVWKNEYSEFREAIGRGKEAFDTGIVENSLLKRALGFEYDEVTKRRQDESVELVVTRVVAKRAIPDVGATSLWLRNRNPKRWREAQHQILSTEQPEILTIEEVKERIWELEEAWAGLAVG